MTCPRKWLKQENDWKKKMTWQKKPTWLDQKNDLLHQENDLTKIMT
jgi:hypothetical protein